MSDFNSIWAQATSQRFKDPKEQKAYEEQRLDMLTTAAVTQAMWRAAKNKLLFFVFGFVFIPPLFFNLATRWLTDPTPAIIGVVGLSAYAVGAVLVWLIGTRLIDGNPDDELAHTIGPLLIAEAEFKNKWGK